MRFDLYTYNDNSMTIRYRNWFLIRIRRSGYLCISHVNIHKLTPAYVSLDNKGMHFTHFTKNSDHAAGLILFASLVLL